MKDSGPQRHILSAMADWEAEADRVVIVLNGIPDDLFRGSAEGPHRILQFSKAAGDQAGEPVKTTASFELKKHPVDIVEVLTHVFEKEDLARRRWRGCGAGQVGQECQITTRYRCVDLTGPVERMWSAAIGKVSPFQRKTKRSYINPFRTILIKSGSHGRVEGGDMVISFDMRVQEGNIAVAYNPFGYLSKAGKVNPVNDTTEAIAAAAAKDGVYSRVIQRLLKIGNPGFITAGKIIVRIAAKGRPDPDAITPLSQRVDANLSSFERHVARGANDGDGIAGAKIWRQDDQVMMGFVVSARLTWPPTTSVCGTPYLKA